MHLHHVCSDRLIEVQLRDQEGSSGELDIPDWILSVGLPDNLTKVCIPVWSETVTALRITLLPQPQGHKINFAHPTEQIATSGHLSSQGIEPEEFWRRDFARFRILVRVIAEKRRIAGFTQEDIKAMVEFWHASDEWNGVYPPE